MKVSDDIKIGLSVVVIISIPMFVGIIMPDRASALVCAFCAAGLELGAILFWRRESLKALDPDECSLINQFRCLTEKEKQQFKDAVSAKLNEIYKARGY